MPATDTGKRSFAIEAYPLKEEPIANSHFAKRLLAEEQSSSDGTPVYFYHKDKIHIVMNDARRGDSQHDDEPPQLTIYG